MLAHSPTASSPQGHPLGSHLLAVARLAAGFAAKWGGGELGLFAGGVHDTGKIKNDFQRYLWDPSGASRGPEHKGAGALLAVRQQAPMLAFVVAGHHGGLMARSDLKAWLAMIEDDPANRKALEELPRMMLDFLPKRTPALPAFVKDVVELEMLIRMTLSALVDADRLDTAAYFAGCTVQELMPPVPSLAELWQRFEASQSSLVTTAAPTAMNLLRREVYAHCLGAAEQPPGFFRLSVPTGGGKTLSAMGFALRHALAHGLDRVIVVIPYTSIIEQTARVYREIFGAEAVLEHHSGIQPAHDPEAPTRAEQYARLATDNWEAPIIVTTSVQFFESLLSDHSSQCRKLHNIARSVVILDEVQTLPPGLLPPIADVLRQLVSHYRTSLIFCSATQPALDHGPYRVLPAARNIVPDPASLFTRLKRVDYHLPEPGRTLTWSQVADLIRGEERVLTIVNTRADALLLLDLLDDPTVLHLSSYLCPAHRLMVLDEIRRRLKAGEPCRAVTTQTVEAGVDLDFPVVIRAMGPLDRIVQAAGRCNREGGPEAGRVVIFRPVGGRLPRDGAYRAGNAEAEKIVSDPSCSLDDPAVFERYFRSLYQDVTLDASRDPIMQSRRALDFPRTARDFRLISEQTIPCLIRWEFAVDAIDRILAGLTADPARLGRRALRHLQPYIVNLPERLLRQSDLLKSILPGLWEWKGGYHPQKGVVVTRGDGSDENG